MLFIEDVEPGMCDIQASTALEDIMARKDDRNSVDSDPALRRDQSVDSAWGWVAGIAVIVLIAFISISGLVGSSH